MRFSELPAKHCRQSRPLTHKLADLTNTRVADLAS
jgi:hypothetical protein